MEYVVGSVAALVSGNVTPSRPKYLKRALTPTKHQPSPNVTPKSEVGDRSIFLSPTLQKKKAIVKKSPKRIFENPDLDETIEGTNSISPKADKVKKHLKIELDTNTSINSSLLSPKSPDESDMVIKSPKKMLKLSSIEKNENENTPTKKNRKRKAPKQKDAEHVAEINIAPVDVSPKKKKNQGKQLPANDDIDNASHKTENVKTGKKNTKLEPKAPVVTVAMSPKKNNKKNKSKKNKPHKEEIKVPIEQIKKSKFETTNDDDDDDDEQGDSDSGIKYVNLNAITNQDTDSEHESDDEMESVKTGKKKTPVVTIATSPKKKNKKNKSKKNKLSKEEVKVPIEQNKKSQIETNTDNDDDDDEQEDSVSESNYVNPNAITNQDTDSEHESDDEMESENDEANKKALQSAEESSDEEVEQKKNAKTENVEKKAMVATEDEIRRTIFVGNVPFNKKTKRDLKKIFNVFGAIETIRIRTVPVKDATVTPKVAVIKNELHPEKSTVNAYVRFANASAVDKALSANNTVLHDHHLRVTRSDTTGAPHDPKCSVFIGNIPFAMEDEKLRSIFEKCGEIESVRIIRDRKTNAGKGFGYVNFASKDGVELALTLPEEDLTIKNRILRVKRSTQGAQKKAQPPGKGYEKQLEGKNQSGDDKIVNGASRRIAKRKKEEKADGPPDKRPRNINQPNREKKPKKEFVGMTAEKKKKNKFDKGQKKKKILGEIMTKK